METDWKKRLLLKITSTKTWFLVASVLLAFASYIGGVTAVLPDWLVQTGVICGVAGGAIYAMATAYQNAAEANADSKTTAITASTTAKEVVQTALSTGTADSK